MDYLLYLLFLAVIFSYFLQRNSKDHNTVQRPNFSKVSHGSNPNAGQYITKHPNSLGRLYGIDSRFRKSSLSDISIWKMQREAWKSSLSSRIRE